MRAAVERAGVPPSRAGRDQVSVAATALKLVDADPPSIEALLDAVFLTAVGWDAASGVLNPPPEHPSLGYALCPVRGCPTRVDSATGLCRTCFLRLATVEMDRETFIAAGVSKRLLRGASCSVPGCPRLRKSPAPGCAPPTTGSESGR